MTESLKCMAVWLAVVAVVLVLGWVGPWMDTPLYATPDEAAAEVRADLEIENKLARVAVKESK